MKKILPLVALSLALSGKSGADELKNNIEIKKQEREYSLSRSYKHSKLWYEGASLGISNENKDFWITSGFYHATDSIENYLMVNPMISTTLLEYCLLQCDSKLSKLSAEARVGAGVTLEMITSETKLKIGGIAAEYIEIPETSIPKIRFRTRMLGQSQLVLRFGMVEGKYSFTFNEHGVGHTIDVGVRF